MCQGLKILFFFILFFLMFLLSDYLTLFLPCRDLIGKEGWDSHTRIPRVAWRGVKRVAIIGNNIEAFLLMPEQRQHLKESSFIIFRPASTQSSMIIHKRG